MMAVVMYSKMTLTLLFTILILITFVFASPSVYADLYSFELMMVNGVKVGGNIGSETPPWVMINTSTQDMRIGVDLIPVAQMDFGNLPIQSPYFTFWGSALQGYTLHPGESIGSTEPNNLYWSLPTPTYQGPSIPRIFEWGG
jgi:hypothetical protein